MGFEGLFCGQPSLDGPDTQAEALSYADRERSIGIGVLLFVGVSPADPAGRVPQKSLPEGLEPWGGGGNLHRDQLHAA